MQILFCQTCPGLLLVHLSLLVQKVQGVVQEAVQGVVRDPVQDPVQAVDLEVVRGAAQDQVLGPGVVLDPVAVAVLAVVLVAALDQVVGQAAVRVVVVGLDRVQARAVVAVRAADPVAEVVRGAEVGPDRALVLVPAVDREPAQVADLGVALAVALDQEVVQEVDQDPAQEAGVDLEVEADREVDQEKVPEVEAVRGADLGQEVDLEAAQDLGQAVAQDPVQEVAVEAVLGPAAGAGRAVVRVVEPRQLRQPLQPNLRRQVVPELS